MKISKDAAAAAGTAPDELELELINRFTKAQLQAEELYIFPVVLCDNKIDRDFERFPVKTLDQLAQLFVGRTGIFDHQWSAGVQKARIYRTELCQNADESAVCGEPYTALKAWAYMLRDGNETLIREIEAGIKKEVSVGCSVKRAVCSICGEDAGTCAHVKGRIYGGEVCHSLLLDASDAYEWSFVAVPAQKEAGVVRKSTNPVISDGGEDQLTPEYQELLHKAKLGEKFMTSLRDEVLRLGLAAEPELERGTLSRVLEKLDENELNAFKQAFSHRLDQLFPPTTQLHKAKQESNAACESQFMI